MIGPDEMRERLLILGDDLDQTAAVYVRSQTSDLFCHAILSAGGELYLSDVGATCEQLARNGTPLDLEAVRAICGAHETTLVEMDGDLVILRCVLDDDSLEGAFDDLESAMAELLMAARLRGIVDPESRRAPLRVSGG